MLTQPAASDPTDLRYGRRAAIALFALTALRLVLVAFVGLGDAEAYYWTWSQHPALSYYDHPPMVSWMIGATTWLGGNAPFFVRLGPVLFFAATSVLVYLLARDMSGRRRVGFVALVLFQLTPAFAIGGQGANPDVPLGFFWMLAAWLFWRATTQDRRALAPLVGIVLGLAFLSKYFALLFMIAALVWLLRHEYRVWWRRPELYVGLILAAALALPVVWWNLEHDWPSVRYHLIRRHGAAGFTLKQAGMFFGGQALYYSPLLFGVYLYALGQLVQRGWRGRGHDTPERRRAFAYLATLAVPTILFFTVVGLWTPQTEPHWTAMAYLPLVIGTAIFWDERTGHGAVVPGGTRRLRIFTRFAAGFPAVLLILAHVHLLSPLFVPLVPERDRPRDIVAETTGWREVGQRAREIASTMRNPLLLHYHYTKCAQLWWSVDAKLPIACLNDRQDQFDFWQDEATLIGRDMLYVTDAVYARRPETVWRFDRGETAATLPILRGGHALRTFTFYRCFGYRGPAEGRRDL